MYAMGQDPSERSILGFLLFCEGIHTTNKQTNVAYRQQWFKWYSKDIFLLRSSRFGIKTLKKIHPTLHYTMRKLGPQRIEGQAQKIMFDSEKYLILYFLYIPSGWWLEVSKEKETRCLTSWISGFRFRDDHIRGQKKKKKKRGKSEKKKKEFLQTNRLLLAHFSTLHGVSLRTTACLNGLKPHCGKTSYSQTSEALPSNKSYLNLSLFLLRCLDLYYLIWENSFSPKK